MAGSKMDVTGHVFLDTTQANENLDKLVARLDAYEKNPRTVQVNVTYKPQDFSAITTKLNALEKEHAPHIKITLDNVDAIKKQIQSISLDAVNKSIADSSQLFQDMARQATTAAAATQRVAQSFKTLPTNLGQFFSGTGGIIDPAEISRMEAQMQESVEAIVASIQNAIQQGIERSLAAGKTGLTGQNLSVLQGAQNEMLAYVQTLNDQSTFLDFEQARIGVRNITELQTALEKLQQSGQQLQSTMQLRDSIDKSFSNASNSVQQFEQRLASLKDSLNIAKESQGNTTGLAKIGQDIDQLGTKIPQLENIGLQISSLYDKLQASGNDPLVRANIQNELTALEQQFQRAASSISASFGQITSRLDTNTDNYVKQIQRDADAAAKAIDQMQSRLNALKDTLQTRSDSFVLGKNGLSGAYLDSYMTQAGLVNQRIGQVPLNAETFDQEYRAVVKLVDELNTYGQVLQQLQASNVKIQTFDELSTSLDQLATRADLPQTLAGRINELRNALSQTAPTDPLGLAKIQGQFVQVTTDINKFDKEVAGYQATLQQQTTNLSKGLFGAVGSESYAEASRLLDELKQKLSTLGQSTNLQQTQSEIQRLIEALRQMRQETDATQASRQFSLAKESFVSDIQVWAQRNSSAIRAAGIDVDDFIRKVQAADRQTMTGLQTEFKTMQAQISSAANVFDKFKSLFRNFSPAILSATLTRSIMGSFTTAAKTLKEVDTYLVEIQKVTRKTTSELRALGDEAFKAASKYGVAVQTYLTGVQEWSRAGYGNLADGLAGLTILAQSAGAMTSEVATKYLLATNAAYQYEGSVAKLNAVLDGQANIANNNAVSLTELAEATQVAGAQAASAGISIDKFSAAVATIHAVTQQGGAVAGRAFRAILMNLQQVTGQTEDGDEITAESLNKYEKAVESLGVKMSTFVNGVQKLRDPIEILRDLAAAYKELDVDDPRRANLLSSVGGKVRSTQFAALLQGWDMYEKMVQEYNSATVGLAEEMAQKTANSWEGTMARLQNSWTSFLSNFIRSDVITGMASGLNSLIQGLDSVASIIGNFSPAGWLAFVASFSMVKNFITTGQGLPNVFASLGSAIKIVAKTTNEAREDMVWFGQSTTGVRAKMDILREGFRRAEDANHSLAASFKFLKGAASTLASIGISLAIGAAISAATKAIDDFVHRAERTAAAAKETIDSYANAQTENTQRRSQIEAISGEFAELQKGVSDSGKNVSLTIEQYTRYQELCGQLIELVPSLSAKYAGQSDVVFKLSENLSELNDEMEREQRLARQNFLQGAGTVVEGAKNNYWEQRKKSGTYEDEAFGGFLAHYDPLEELQIYKAFQQVNIEQEANESAEDYANRYIQALIASLPYELSAEAKGVDASAMEPTMKFLFDSWGQYLGESYNSNDLIKSLKSGTTTLSANLEANAYKIVTDTVNPLQKVWKETLAQMLDDKYADEEFSSATIDWLNGLIDNLPVDKLMNISSKTPVADVEYWFRDALYMAQSANQFFAEYENLEVSYSKGEIGIDEFTTRAQQIFENLQSFDRFGDSFDDYIKNSKGFKLNEALDAVFDKIDYSTAGRVAAGEDASTEQINAAIAEKRDSTLAMLNSMSEDEIEAAKAFVDTLDDSASWQYGKFEQWLNEQRIVEEVAEKHFTMSEDQTKAYNDAIAARKALLDLYYQSFETDKSERPDAEQISQFIFKYPTFSNIATYWDDENRKFTSGVRQYIVDKIPTMFADVRAEVVSVLENAQEGSSEQRTAQFLLDTIDSYAQIDDSEIESRAAEASEKIQGYFDLYNKVLAEQNSPSENGMGKVTKELSAETKKEVEDALKEIAPDMSIEDVLTESGKVDQKKFRDLIMGYRNLTALYYNEVAKMPELGTKIREETAEALDDGFIDQYTSRVEATKKQIGELHDALQTFMETGHLDQNTIDDLNWEFQLDITEDMNQEAIQAKLNQKMTRLYLPLHTKLVDAHDKAINEGDTVLADYFQHLIDSLTSSLYFTEYLDNFDITGIAVKYADAFDLIAGALGQLGTDGRLDIGTIQSIQQLADESDALSDVFKNADGQIEITRENLIQFLALYREFLVGGVSANLNSAFAESSAPKLQAAIDLFNFMADGLGQVQNDADAVSFKQWDDEITKADESLEHFKNTLSRKELTGDTATVDDLNKEIELANKAIETRQAKRTQAIIQAGLANNEADRETFRQMAAELQGEIDQYEADIIQWRKDIDSLNLEAYSDGVDAAERRLTMIQNDIAERQARGMAQTINDYQKLIDQSDEIIAANSVLKAYYESQLVGLDESSKRYKDIRKAIDSCDDAIQSARQNQLEWNQAILENFGFNGTTSLYNSLGETMNEVFTQQAGAGVTGTTAANLAQWLKSVGVDASKYIRTSQSGIEIDNAAIRDLAQKTLTENIAKLKGQLQNAKVEDQAEIQFNIDLLVNAQTELLNATSEIAQTTAAYNSLRGEMDAVNEATVQSGISSGLTLETYQQLTSYSKAYASALVYEDGRMQMNRATMISLTEARRKELQAQIAASKSDAMKQYDENQRRISALIGSYDSLGQAYQSLTSAQRIELNSLLSQQSYLTDTVNQYNILADSIDSTRLALERWQQAQSEPQEDDLYYSLQEAYETIQAGEKSGKTGKGTLYNRATEFVFGQGQTSTTKEQQKILDRYFKTSDDSDEAKTREQERKNLQNFVDDLVKWEYLNYDKANDRYEQIADEINFEEVGEKAGISPAAVEGLVRDLLTFDWDIDFKGDAFEGTGGYEQPLAEELQGQIDEWKQELAKLTVEHLTSPEEKQRIAELQQLIADGETKLGELPEPEETEPIELPIQFKDETIQAAVDAFIAKFTDPANAAPFGFNPDSVETAIEDVVNRLKDAFGSLNLFELLMGDNGGNGNDSGSGGSGSSGGSAAGIAGALMKSMYLPNANLLNRPQIDVGDGTATVLSQTFWGSDFTNNGQGIDSNVAINVTPIVKLKGEDGEWEIKSDDDIYNYLNKLWSDYNGNTNQIIEADASGDGWHAILDIVGGEEDFAEVGDAYAVLLHDLQAIYYGIAGDTESIAGEMAESIETLMNSSYADTFSTQVANALQNHMIPAVDQAKQSADNLSSVEIGDLGADQTENGLTDVLNLLKQIAAIKIADKSFAVRAIHEEGSTNPGRTLASGTSNAKPGKTLVGELGPELLVRNGHYYILGATGPEIADMQPGDIVFSAKQTEDLLRKGSTGQRGQALAGGGSVAGLKFMAGKGLKDLGKSASSSKKKSSKSSSKTSSSTKKSSGSSGKTSGDSDTDQWFDYVEIRINRLARLTSNLEKEAEIAIGYLNQNAILTDAMVNTLTELDTAAKAYDRYMEHANMLAGEFKLDTDILDKIHDGTIDITKYSDEVAKNIKEYQSWYEKALQVKDSVYDLKDQLKKLATTKLDNIINQFEKMQTVIDDSMSFTDAGIELSDAVGQVVDLARYNDLIDMNAQKIINLQSEYNALSKEFTQLVDGGYIQKGTDEWYDYQSKLDNISTEMLRLKKTTQDYVDTINNIKVDRITYVLNELEYMGEKLKEIGELNDLIGIKSDYVGDYHAQIDNLNQQYQTQKAIVDELIRQQETTEKGAAKYEEFAQKIRSAEKSAQDLVKQMIQLNTAINELPLEALKQDMELIEHTQSSIESVMKFHQAQGITDSGFVEEYEALIEVGWKEIDNLQRQRQELIYLQRSTQEGSERWRDYTNKLHDVNKQILSVKADMETWNSSIIDLAVSQVQDYRDSLEKANEKLQRRLELEKAIEELERARTQRSMLIYREGKPLPLYRVICIETGKYIG